MTMDEAREMYENSSDDVKAVMEILSTMNAEELKDITLFLKFGSEDPKGANWIIENWSKLSGLSFATMIQLAKNELYGDTE